MRSGREVWVGADVYQLLSRLVLGTLLAVVVTGCGTKVDTDRGQLQVNPQQPQIPAPQVPQVPQGSDPYGGSYTPPPSTTTPYYPPTTNTSLTCYVERSGGYYYSGQAVYWNFTSETGEPLQITRIDTYSRWNSQPQYPLPAYLGITFHNVGQYNLGFTVQSTSRPGVYCNGGYPIQDTVYINSWY